MEPGNDGDDARFSQNRRQRRRVQRPSRAARASDPLTRPLNSLKTAHSLTQAHRQQERQISEKEVLPVCAGRKVGRKVGTFLRRS